MTSQGETEIPSRPKEEAPAEGAPSKNAMKKAQKEKEKAEKAAKRQAQEQEEKAKAEASDTAKHLYGLLSTSSPPPARMFVANLKDLEGVGHDEEVTVQARVYNARVQSAKLAFLVLREQEHTIQVVIAEGGRTWHLKANGQILWRHQHRVIRSSDRPSEAAEGPSPLHHDIEPRTARRDPLCHLLSRRTTSPSK